MKRLSSLSSSSRHAAAATVVSRTRTTRRRRTTATTQLLLFVAILFGLILLVQSTSSTSSSSSSTSTSSTSTSTTRSLPRSHNGRTTSISGSSNSLSTTGDDASSSSSQQDQQQQQQRLLQYPPWNPSNKIKQDGFLHDLYRRIPGEWEKEIHFNTIYHLNDHNAVATSSSSSHDTRKKKKNGNASNSVWCQIRQVPGDGNCLFHSISLCLHHATNNGTHWNMMSSNSNKKSSSSSISSNSNSELQDLFQHSQKLRQDAVTCLQQTHRRLILQGSEKLRCSELVEAAAQQYGLSSLEYCQCMSQDSVWGGGPEIVALCNILRRPIHVYELATITNVQQHQYHQLQNNNNKRKSIILASSASSSTTRMDDSSHQSSSASSSSCFVLRRMACFGSPCFDKRQPLHILSADSRFPDLEPGQQLSAGNHFLAVFPITDNDDDHDDDARNKKRKRRKRVIRGGGHFKNQKNGNNEDDDDDDEMYDVDDDDEDFDCQNSQGRGPWRWLNLWRRLL